jgi:dCMP deaminase
MELKIDDNFKRSYSSYFNDLNEKFVLDHINGIFSDYDAGLVIDAVNVIKTAGTLGMTYTDCYDKVVSSIIDRFPSGKDIDSFVLCLVVKILIASGSSDIEKVLFKSRDVYKEVTAKYFRVQPNKVTDNMVRTVLKASAKFTKDSYSIDDPPVEGWDDYFYNVCRQVARHSKCFSRRIGAVLVYDKAITSTGYNGPPRGIPKCDLRWKLDEDFAKKYGDKIGDQKVKGRCPRHVIGFKSGEGLEVCPAGHAERNALINAARKGIATKGSSLYMTCGIPCSPCLVEIINAGVEEIVVTSLQVYDETAMYLIKQSNLEVRLFNFIK